MKTKRITATATKLQRISQLSARNSNMVFNCLMPHVNKESLIECFYELKGNRAVGIDQKTKFEYGQELDKNIDLLLTQMKSMSYRPQPVREVLIPKSDEKKKRTLGISNFEDKIVQLMFNKILEAIYEPVFHNCSYGFRQGRSCHLATKDLRNTLDSSVYDCVLDVDLENYFGNINHKKLVKLLEMKIKDKTFIRYVIRMLKAGVLTQGELQVTDRGSPQGSIVSPVLSNVFAHYALDEWFCKTVKAHTSSRTEMYRYCDDFVILCDANDLERIKKSLIGRMNRFSLKINMQKTKTISFNKHLARKGVRQESFDFLGFTFYLAKSRNNKYFIVKLKTSRRRYSSKLRLVKSWCRLNRHRAKLKDLWEVFVSKLRGHIQYYGVSFNSKNVSSFVNHAVRIFFKWMNRRSQRKSFTWQKFELFLKQFPPPRALVVHKLF